MWPFGRTKGVSVTIVSDTESQRAIQRALAAKRDAEVDYQEMKARAHRAVCEREKNHFAPLIWEAMQRKDIQ